MAVFTRKMDVLGRVVVPKELRTSMGADDGDMIEIVGVEGGVLLRKHRPAGEVLALAEELYAALDADKTIEPSVERLIRRQMEGIIQALTLTESDKTLDAN